MCTYILTNVQIYTGNAVSSTYMYSNRYYLNDYYRKKRINEHSNTSLLYNRKTTRRTRKKNVFFFQLFDITVDGFDITSPR